MEASDTMKCGHTAEVRLSWLGHRDERRTAKVCEACAAVVWNNLPHPLRETFTCVPILREA